MSLQIPVCPLPQRQEGLSPQTLILLHNNLSLLNLFQRLDLLGHLVICACANNSAKMLPMLTSVIERFPSGLAKDYLDCYNSAEY